MGKFQQAYAEEYDDTWWDVPDTQQDIEQTVVDCADAELFIQALDPQDLEILRQVAHENNRCVIIVTHDPAVADAADVVLRMKDGLLEPEA